MILQKLATSLRRRDWGAAIIEVGIVVLGIFIGLQVDDWNKARNDGVLELEYAQRLVADFDTMRTENAEGVAIIEQANARLKRVNQLLLEVNGEAQVDLDQVKSDLGSLDFFPGLQAKSAVLEELFSTGNIKVIQDAGLRADLSALAAKLNRRTETNQLHFATFLKLRDETHKNLVLIPTDTSVEKIAGTLEDLRSAPLLRSVVSFSIELNAEKQSDWLITEAELVAVRDKIARRYGMEPAS